VRDSWQVAAWIGTHPQATLWMLVTLGRFKTRCSLSQGFPAYRRWLHASFQASPCPQRCA